MPSNKQYNKKEETKNSEERKRELEKPAQFPVDGESFFSAGPSADGRLPLG